MIWNVALIGIPEIELGRIDFSRSPSHLEIQDRLPINQIHFIKIKNPSVYLIPILLAHDTELPAVLQASHGSRHAAFKFIAKFFGRELKYDGSYGILKWVKGSWKIHRYLPKRNSRPCSSRLIAHCR